MIGVSLRAKLVALRHDQLAISLSHATSVSMAVRLAGLLLAFLSHLVLSRLLGPVQYGSYVVALGCALVLVIPARLGLDNSVLRYATVYREQGRGGDFRGLIIFSLSVIAATSILIIASIIGIKLVAGDVAGPLPVQLLAGVVMLIPFLAVLGWFSALVRTANRIFASQFYDQVLRPILLIAAIIALSFTNSGLDASSAMLATGFTVGIAMVCIAAHAGRVFKGISGDPSFEHRREWLSVSWVMFLIAASQELLNQIDIIFLGILGQATQAAHFAVAWRLASLVPFALIAIGTVSGPLIASASHRGDLAELERISRFNARFSTLFAVLISVLLAVIGRTALGWFGPGFEAAYPALLVLLAGGLLNSFTGTVGYLLIMTGHQRAAFIIIVGALAFSVSANMLLIPRYGAIGAAIASAVALSVWNLAMAIHARRQIGVDATALGLPRLVLETDSSESSGALGA